MHVRQADTEQSERRRERESGREKDNKVSTSHLSCLICIYLHSCQSIIRTEGHLMKKMQNCWQLDKSRYPYFRLFICLPIYLSTCLFFFFFLFLLLASIISFSLSSVFFSPFLDCFFMCALFYPSFTPSLPPSFTPSLPSLCFLLSSPPSLLLLLLFLLHLASFSPPLLPFFYSLPPSLPPSFASISFLPRLLSPVFSFLPLCLTLL